MRGGGKVPVGGYTISVSPPAQGGQAGPENPEAYKAMMTGEAQPAAEPTAPFPQKYQGTATSGETFTVKEGANNYNLDMTDAP